MKLPELHNASLILRDGTEVRIINPRLVDKKGLIQVHGILDYHSFTDEKDVENKLELKREKYSENDFLSIRGYEKHGTELLITSIIISSVTFNSLEVQCSCYGHIDGTMSFNKSEKDYLYSIGFEGLKMYFDRLTTTKQERDILGKSENHTLTMRKDFTEAWAAFNRDRSTIDLNFALLNSKDEDLVYFILHDRSYISLELYQEIRFSLTSFLSFACGNNIAIRRESYYKNGIHHSITFSGKKVKQRSHSNFIPLNNISFLHEKILHNYMETFETYLFIDKHFDLSQIILLLNQAKSAQVDSSIFIMLIALEKLADRYVSSPFFKTKPNYIVNTDAFEELTKSIKPLFDKSLRSGSADANKNQIDDLWSRIVNVNRKGKTEDKIEQLLNFAEIRITPEISRLFTVLRNKAIHQGEINLPEGTAYENKTGLEMLMNRVISNLIQYRGIRYIRTEARTNICEQKKDFVTDYEKFGMSRVLTWAKTEPTKTPKD